MSWAETMKMPVAHLLTFMAYVPLIFLTCPLILLYQPKSKVLLPLPERPQATLVLSSFCEGIESVAWPGLISLSRVARLPPSSLPPCSPGRLKGQVSA